MKEFAVLSCPDKPEKTRCDLHRVVFNRTLKRVFILFYFITGHHKGVYVLEYDGKRSDRVNADLPRTIFLK